MSNPNRPLVLIAEDNAIMADVVRRALEHGGFDVHISNNGQEALEACQDRDFDAVVTDYQMPRMNGLEFVQALRKSDRNQNVPLVFVSGKGMELDSESMKQDFDVHKVMFKPFSPRELITTLESIIAEHTANV